MINISRKKKFIPKRKKRMTMKKIVTFVFVVIFIAITLFLFNKYSLTTKRIDLKQYLKVEGNDVVIYLNDVYQVDNGDGIKFRALYSNDSVYIPLSFTKKYLNNRFYHDKSLNKILYCLPDEVRVAGNTDIHQIGNAPYVVFKDEPYLLIDYIKDFTNIRYDKYTDEESKRIYIYNDWDKEKLAYIKTRESARVRGGNKSPIITDLKKGEEVKLLDVMIKWAKVKTANGYIGYVRKSKLVDEKENIPVSSFIERTRNGKKMDVKPCIGFHQLYSSYESNKLPELLKKTNGMNVIAPTWFTIKNDEGDIRSIANNKYSQYCRAKGYGVWATVNNFDIADVDEKAIFSNAIIRKKIITKILREVDVNALDGINLDIEDIDPSAGEDYVQFVRELSIELSKVGCILSVDTYVPYIFNKHYDLKEFNDFCDYVVIMCYDEHYAGSKEAGSVSSLKYVTDGVNLSLEKIDKGKLIIALPFYSRLWSTSTSGKVSSIANSSENIEGSAIAQGLKFTFDSKTGQNYGVKIAEDGTKYECWLEDALSLAYKMNVIKDADVAGTAAWKLTQERDGYFQIINLNSNVK